MRAKPSTSTRAGKSNRTTVKSQGGNTKGIIKKNKDLEKKIIPDLSVLRQPVDTSICGLKQAVKIFETGTPEVLHLLTYDCDVVYECKVCRNLFRSIANFISHKRVYCTLRYSRSQDLRSNKEGEDYTVILGEKATEKLPTRITARKDLTCIVESLGGHNPTLHYLETGPKTSTSNDEKKTTTVHLEPMDNTSYGVFQTVLKPDSQNLMRTQVTELQTLLSQNEVVLGPDGRILQNGFSDLPREEKEEVPNDENGLVCSSCNIKFANRKTLTKHKRLMHESVRTSYSCPCCKNYFANPWSVYRHLYKVHRKTNEQVRRLRAQIHKRDTKVDKPVLNIVNKKASPPSKRKTESEQHLRIHQDNKEWMDHFEDDWELQRCGGCGRKFERKAALISHSQICQKRIAACNRIEQNHQVSAMNINPVVSLSPISCSKKPVPKQCSEKKIGIQVRMNYCKNSSTSSVSSLQVSSRQPSSSRSVFSDESDILPFGVDEKEAFIQNAPMKTSIDFKESSVLEQFLKDSDTCDTEKVDELNSLLNNDTDGIDKAQTYDISACKRSFLRSSVGKNKSLEAKCLQLRTALENEITDTSKSESKEKEVENAVYLDVNIDNTSESNNSAVSSLSSQLTPLVDKGDVCETEEAVEMKNIDISKTLENIPSTEADSTSMANGGGLHMTYNSLTFKENNNPSPNIDLICEEVSTSVPSDEIHQEEFNLHVDSSFLNDDEVSISLKPIDLLKQEPKSFIQESELENTISILTRNQLKAICKDDLLPINGEKKCPLADGVKKSVVDIDVEAATREIRKKKLHKYADLNRNTCTICNKKFKKIQNLYRHICSHTRWKRYECLFNGCTFQTFLKATCLHHATLHSKQSNMESTDALVGIINPAKWNLRLVDKPASVQQSKTLVKITSAAQKRDKPSQQLIKTVSIKQEKSKLKTKQSLKIEVKKANIPKLLSTIGSKQKLLTEFKNFKGVSSLNGKKVTQPNKIKKKILQSPKRKISVNNISKRKLKSSPVRNGVPIKDKLPSKPGKPAAKKQRLSANSTEQLKEKLPVIKKELREEEIIINHITLDSSDTSFAKGRSSRSSSRKSSVSSLVDQQKGKTILNTIVKIEESTCSPLYPPLAYDSQSSQSSINIQNSEIVDGSSMEEEEIQESDKPVDDSHLKKIFMEVIFGPPPNPLQAPGRPVRNKTRPKRDSDFILGSQKDSDREASDGKLNPSKKSIRSSTDPKTLPEASRKSK